MDIRELWDKKELILKMEDQCTEKRVVWELYASPNRKKPEWFYIVKMGHLEHLVKLYDISESWENIHDTWNGISEDWFQAEDTKESV